MNDSLKKVYTGSSLFQSQNLRILGGQRGNGLGESSKAVALSSEETLPGTRSFIGFPAVLPEKLT
jgi:hypothetical protein